MSFKANLVMTMPDLKVNIPVRYSRIKETNMNKSVIHKDLEGNPVKFSSTDLDGKPLRFSKNWLNSDGVVPKDHVKHFTVLPNGEEVEIAPYQRSKSIEIMTIKPKDILKTVLIEKTYEVFAEDVETAKQIADYLGDSVGCFKFSFGRGFTEYIGFLTPVIDGDKFILLMYLSKTKIEYANMMDIKEKAKEMPKLPTLTDILS